MGDEFQLAVTDVLMQYAGTPDHHDAKSRWTLQRFHDPDIAILNRSVPIPETADTPLCLQEIASLKAKAWVGDVRGAFSQGLRGQRPEPLFATPPTGARGR